MYRFFGTVTLGKLAACLCYLLNPHQPYIDPDRSPCADPPAAVLRRSSSFKCFLVWCVYQTLGPSGEAFEPVHRLFVSVEAVSVNSYSVRTAICV
jgi:hypothetical protein